jgi:hypothetical protein
VYWGLNAVKNAFDRRFMERLVEWGPRLLEFSYYFKGYAYIQQPYFYSNIEIVNRQNQNVAKNLLFLYEGTYYPVLLSESPQNNATVFDYVYEHPLICILSNGVQITIAQNNLINLYVENSPTNFVILRDYNVSFQKEGIINLANTEFNTIEEIPNTQPKNRLKNLCVELANSRKVKDIVPILSQDNAMSLEENGELLRHNSGYAIFYGTLKGFNRSLTRIGNSFDVDTITPKMGWSVISWRHRSNSQPTWCNVYAADLSYKVFGLVDGDSPVPYGQWGFSADRIGKLFSANSVSYKRIPDKTRVWENFINLGFPVYFVGGGHIETGWPDEGIPSVFGLGNKRWPNEPTKLDRSLIESLDHPNYTIGAGSLVGFKNYKGYNWLKSGGTNAFLYLGYLKNVYD